MRGSSPTVREGARRNYALAHARATAPVRQEHPFAGNPRNVVEDFIHCLKAEVRHPNRVGVGIAKRDAQLSATLEHPAIFAGELSFVAVDNVSHQCLVLSAL